MDALTIHEAAETTGWSARMLRYVERSGLETALSRRFHEALSVKLDVKAVGKGELAHLTGISGPMKARRLLDRRKTSVDFAIIG